MIAEHETTGPADADGTCDPQPSDCPDGELFERWQTGTPFLSDVHNSALQLLDRIAALACIPLVLPHPYVALSIVLT